MSDELFHCVCRTCPVDHVASDVAGRAQFFEEHSDHEMLTVALPTDDGRPEPESRVVRRGASD